MLSVLFTVRYIEDDQVQEYQEYLSEMFRLKQFPLHLGDARIGELMRTTVTREHTNVTSIGLLCEGEASLAEVAADLFFDLAKDIRDLHETHHVEGDDDESS